LDGRREASSSLADERVEREEEEEEEEGVALPLLVLVLGVGGGGGWAGVRGTLKDMRPGEGVYGLSVRC